LKTPFALSWQGGAAERHFRNIRPGVDELPWGTLRPEHFPPLLVDRARVSWTEAAYNEYCTAASFADLLAALLACGAPVDLVGMASDFVADEMSHVELTSRIAMELGGGAPYAIDFDDLSAMRPNARQTALERANEMVVRLCCVGEAFSVNMLAGCMKSAGHPLTRGVLEIIVKDEAPHGLFGRLYLDWAANHMDEAERHRLAAAALDMIRRFEPYWRRLRSVTEDGITSEGFRIEQVHELGWMEAQAYAATAREAIRRDVIAPLADYGIDLDPGACAALLG
jgi:hypothetical protein